MRCEDVQPNDPATTCFTCTAGVWLHKRLREMRGIRIGLRGVRIMFFQSLRMAGFQTYVLRLQYLSTLHIFQPAGLKMQTLFSDKPRQAAGDRVLAAEKLI